MKNDYEYIKDKFEDDGVKTPDSLSEDSILSMLPDREQEAPASSYEPVKLKRNRLITQIAALAACALIAVIGAPKAYYALAGAPDTSMVDGELRTFGSQSEIERLINSMDKSEGFSLFRYKGDAVEEMEMSDADSGADLMLDDIAPLEAPAAPATGASNAYGGAGGGSADHSETYLQVEEVDEADIVKTDGSYIYYVNNREEVVILSAKDGKTEKLSTIGSGDIDNYINDIFLKDDTLVTIGRIYDYDDGDLETGCTAIVTYDISDRSHPEMISEFRQTGDIVSSRMVGDYVYLITNDYVYRGGRVVPMCSVDGKFSDMPVQDICCVPEPMQTSYVILSAVDITSGKQAKSKSKAVFGASNTIYCNDHNLYAAVAEWERESGSYYGQNYTRVIRASLDGLKIKWNGTGRVPGYIDDQFSMDERDGYFRIATTSQRDGMDVNNLFVLDEKLKTAGKLTGFARNESIKSVRYIGSKAYVITYEAIDPLFVIDLSDPVKPVIDGEVKIDGFSTLLVPVSDDKLLGIGYATGDNGYGGEYAAGLKLALFDISDPSKPAVIDSKEFENMNSPAQYTHLALVVNRKDGWYAIPYGIDHYPEDETNSDVIEIEEDVAEDTGSIDAEASETTDGEEITILDEQVKDEYWYEAGVLVFGADPKINVIDQHRLESEMINRSVYIGDYIYALDDDGNVSSFKVSKQ